MVGSILLLHSTWFPPKQQGEPLLPMQDKQNALNTHETLGNDPYSSIFIRSLVTNYQHDWAPGGQQGSVQVQEQAWLKHREGFLETHLKELLRSMFKSRRLQRNEQIHCFCLTCSQSYRDVQCVCVCVCGHVYLL